MSAIASIKTAQLLSASTGFRFDMIGKTTDAGTGVSRTYDPEGFQLPGVASWVDRSGGIAIGYPRISLSLRPPTKASRLYKCVLKVSLPTLEQTSASTASGIQPAPTLAYQHLGVLEMILPERGALWERKALLDTLHSLFLTTITASDGAPSDATGSPLAAAVENFDPPY